MSSKREYTAHFDGGTNILHLSKVNKVIKRDIRYWGYQIWDTACCEDCAVTSNGNHFPIHNPIKQEHGFNYFSDRKATNNEAEYIALIKLLEYFKYEYPYCCQQQGIHACERDYDKTVNLTIKGDSKLVINQVFGDWETRAYNLKSFNEYAKELVHALTGTNGLVVENLFLEISTSHSPRDEHLQRSVDKWARGSYVD